MNLIKLIKKFLIIQNMVSWIVAKIPPYLEFTVGKYLAIKKALYITAHDETFGSYIEFGVFTGSSFCHSIRCNRKLSYLNPSTLSTKFFGFDSFQGFGEIEEDDKHSFYTDENFDTDFVKVKNRVAKVAKNTNFELIPGFFKNTLSNGPSSLGIK